MVTRSTDFLRRELMLLAVFPLILAGPVLGQVISPPFTDNFAELKGWASEDIGDAWLVGGTETSVSGNELIVVGSGTSFTEQGGGARFVYQKISGDFIAQAKVTLVPTYQPGSAAGLMVRQDTGEWSPMAFAAVTRDQGTFFVARSSDEEFSADSGSGTTVKPIWLRLERRGDLVQGYYSLDGETWINLVGASGAASWARIPLKDPVLLGFAVNAANNTAVDPARFADFSVVRPAAGTGGVSVEVTVKDTSEPAEGAYVAAIGPDGKELRGTYVTAGRAVILSGLPAGSVKLRAVGRGYQAAETTVNITADRITEASLQVASTTAAPPTGRVTGTVTDDAGKPQSGAKVRAISQGATALGPLFQTATTNSKGAYVLDLPPGTYSVVRLADPRYVPVHDDVKRDVVVTADATATVDFKVQSLPVAALTTDNGYNWKIKIPAEDWEDHKAINDPEEDFQEYVVGEGKYPWGVIDPTARIYAWVRLRFKLPESFKPFQGNDLRLYDFTFEDVDTTYFNEVKIGSAGFHLPDVNDDTGFVSAWNTVRDYRVPASAVNWEGENVIAIRGFVRNSTVENGGFSVKSPPRLTVIQSTTPPIVKGDLNGDGKVTVPDVTLALRFAVGVGKPSTTQLRAGDINNNGRIDTADVTQILRAAVGLIKL
ncbi:MAG: carboxypeptidase regulatory-like domain-containing protein [Armatimonadota bacterium]